MGISKIRIQIKSIIAYSKKGEATGFATVIFSIAVIIILYFYVFQHYITNSEIEKSADALVISNLAVYKDINTRVLADDPQNIIITDCNMAFYTFKKHLRINFDLDSNDNPLDNSYIKSKITINNFIIYNVSGEDVIILTYIPEANNFQIDMRYGEKGEIRTPKGTIVSETTVHSSISFDIGILNQKRNIIITEDTDIINTNYN